MEHPKTVAPADGANGKEVTQVRTAQVFSPGSPQHSDAAVQAPAQCIEQVSEQSAEFVEKHGVKLERARVRTAWMFEDLLGKHARLGHSAYSRRALAAKYVEDDETIVRKWANGKKPIPLAALLVLPDEIVEDLIGLIRAERKRGGRP